MMSLNLLSIGIGILLVSETSSRLLTQVGESIPNRAVWSVNYTGTNITCILFDATLEFGIPYEDMNGLIQMTYVPVPSNASDSGSCGAGDASEVQTLSLTWPAPTTTGKENNLTFIFTKNSSVKDEEVIFNGYFLVREIQATIHTNPHQFINALDPEKVYNLTATSLSIMSAPLDLSYSCRSNQYVDFGNDTALEMSDVQSEAFYKGTITGNGLDFGPRSFCPRDAFNMVLTVITYICILCLIGITIVLILQRACKRSGYRRVP